MLMARQIKKEVKRSLYYNEDKRLVERIEFDMAQAESDPGQLALEVDSSAV